MQRAQAAGLTVRRFSPSDTAALLDLVDALADYEHLARPDAAARARFARDAAAPDSPFSVLLAEREGQVVGYALCFLTYSTFLAKPTLYVEDMFVLSEHRGQGVATTLMREMAREAVSRGCGRMEWQVLAWNELAKGLYRELGAELLEDWQPCRLSADKLQRLASAQPNAGV